MEQEIIYRGRKATLVTSNFQAPQIRTSNFQYVVLPTTDFDPDFSPEHPTNQEAARQRDLTYDPSREVYIDEDGCLMRDKFGQSL